jgi:hypothetical protein
MSDTDIMTWQVEAPPELEREGKKQKVEKPKGEKEKGEKEKGEKEKGEKEKGEKEKGEKEKGEKEKGEKQKGDKEKGDKEKGDKEKGDKEKGEKPMLFEVGNKRKAIRELLDDTIAAMNVSVTELTVKIDAMQQVQDKYDKKKEPFTADMNAAWKNAMNSSHICTQGISGFKKACVDMKKKSTGQITFPNIESFAESMKTFEEDDQVFKKKASTARTSWKEMRTMCDKMMDVYQDFLMKPAE